MDYVEVFKNLRTNNKYGRKSPHKAVLMLTVIEMYEKNVLTDNEIYYDDSLKSTFLRVWNRVLYKEPLFHQEAFLPFWYLQNDSFWHIMPKRGHEDILSLMRDINVKPSEAKLNESVKCAELDEDLYFLMTLPSGRYSLRRALLETYTNLSEDEIERQSESRDNSIDYSVSAMSDYENLLSKGQEQGCVEAVAIDNELFRQFHMLNEDVQIVLNIQYYSFLKEHRSEREMFKEICPTVYAMFDKIVNFPVKQGEIAPSFTFIYDNFLADLKIALMSEDGSMEIVDKIDKAIDVLCGNNRAEDEIETAVEEECQQLKDDENMELHEVTKESSSVETEVEHVFLDSHGNVINTITTESFNLDNDTVSENRKGKAWSEEEEELLTRYFKLDIDTSVIAEKLGRTEVAIKSRLAKLGLIEYAYGQDEASLAKSDNKLLDVYDEKDFTIENSFTRGPLFNKNNEKVFSTAGKLKYLQGKLYRLNLKKECFTLKAMTYNGEVWMKGDKKIVAYPWSKLYRVVDAALDSCDVIEEIIDNAVF